jgi:hypothetical protein
LSPRGFSFSRPKLHSARIGADGDRSIVWSDHRKRSSWARFSVTTVLACRLPRTSAQTSARHHPGTTHPIRSLLTERSAVQRLALTEPAFAADWHMACERCAGR